jgi:hypothetical protein
VSTALELQSLKDKTTVLVQLLSQFEYVRVSVRHTFLIQKEQWEVWFTDDPVVYELTEVAAYKRLNEWLKGRIANHKNEIERTETLLKIVRGELAL